MLVAHEQDSEATIAKSPASVAGDEGTGGTQASVHRLSTVNITFSSVHSMAFKSPKLASRLALNS